MEKITTHYVTFESPGSFVAESWKQAVAGPDPRKVEWPENAYAFRLFKREDVIDGGKVYTGKSEQIGKLYYHPDSVVQSLDEARANPKATPVLISNMECNHWDQIVWTRWGNWPQPFDPATTEVLR
jgi:hypothetical protein